MRPFWSPSSESTYDSSDEDVLFESQVASSASLSYLCLMPVEEERSVRPDVCARKEKRMWRKLLHPKVISEVSVSLPVKGLTSTPLLKLLAFSPSTFTLDVFYPMEWTLIQRRRNSGSEGRARSSGSCSS